MKSDQVNGGLRIGTSGWSYKHWSGIFYPEDLGQGKFLEYYIKFFDCVELNSSFYHLPRTTTIGNWIKRTPGSFRFCPKLSRFITHRKRLDLSEAPLKNFFNLFEEMKARLGPVLIQLPPGLKFDESLAVEFFRLLKELGRNYRFALEVRHKSWINDGLFDLLARYNIAFVIADSGKRFPSEEKVTTDFVYLRMHGPEKLYASDYPDQVLHNYAGKVSNWLKSNKDVWAFFNNDFHGYAIKNAKKLSNLVQSQLNS